MGADDLTRNEILEALAQAYASRDDGAGGVTFAELRAASGWGEKRVRALVTELHRAGRLEVVRVQRTRIDGAVVPVVAYRLAGGAPAP